jgi:hypothetical protein
VDEVVTRLFNGSIVLADAFRSDILVKTRRLHLGNSSDADLAAKLGGIYQEIQRVRNGVPVLAGVPGPLELVSRYVDWLGTQEWINTATARVLSIESPAFQRFRRQESALHPHAIDPLLGR